MGQTCSQCSRVSPADALYCYFDGLALPGQAARNGPVHVGTQPFPTPFVFPNGRSCRNFDQLALACQDDWPAAIRALENGDLANFLGGLGRSDLAQVARETTRNPNRPRGLDAFLSKLPSTVLQAARLKVEPSEVNLGEIRVGEERTLKLRVANLGMRLLYGTVTCDDCVWLSLGDAAGTSQKIFQLRDEWVLTIHVQGKRLTANSKPYECRLLVESNGGTTTVLVRATVPVKPFPAGALAGSTTPRQVAEIARANPKDVAAFFENGMVAQWYRDNGWNYPVQGPASSSLGAIQQFFEALGLARPPRVELSQQHVQLQGTVGEEVRHELEVRTQENRWVYALASSNQPWLMVECTPPKGRTAAVWLNVRSVPDCPGETLQAQVTVRANGNQRFVVPVSLVVRRAPGNAPAPSKPAPAWSSSRATAIPEHATTAMAPVAATVAPLYGEDLSPAIDGEAGARQRSRWLWHLLPTGFLLLILGGMFLRDTTVPSGSPPVEEPKEEEFTLLDPVPRLALRLHETPDDIVPSASMRFGLVMPQEKNPDAQSPTKFKKLTFDEWGRSNNTCLKIDGKEVLFGQEPGSWKERRMPLGKDPRGWERDGVQSIWSYDEPKLLVTQTVEIVPGQVSRLLDTCLVRYKIENRDARSHQVGLRFMLDTFIGLNDGVPFTLPGLKGLCDTQQEFNQPSTVPDFIQALEREDLVKPGTVAHLQLRLGGRLEPPERVTLGAWPNFDLSKRLNDPRFKHHMTLWDVPVVPMKTMLPPDSAVVMYWLERELKPGESRELGFAYGLGKVASGEGGGKLGLTVGGSLTVGGEFSVTAYVTNPVPGQRLTLHLPEGLELKGDSAEQAVPPLPENATSRNSPVTWKVQAVRRGQYLLKVESTTGVTQTQGVTIRQRSIFD